MIKKWKQTNARMKKGRIQEERIERTLQAQHKQDKLKQNKKKKASIEKDIILHTPNIKRKEEKVSEKSIYAPYATFRKYKNMLTQPHTQT